MKKVNQKKFGNEITARSNTLSEILQLQYWLSRKISIMYREVVIRANYCLEWKKNFTCTTFSPFTFTYNHENSNFPPFLTNLWKKDFFLLQLGFEPGPPGWQSTILAIRPGSHDMYRCQLFKPYSNFLFSRREIWNFMIVSKCKWGSRGTRKFFLSY